jgi:hypothetical protein
MLRAQTAAAALAAGLSVLSNFVAVALNPRDADGASNETGTAVAEPEPVEAQGVGEPTSHDDLEVSEELIPLEVEPLAEEEPQVAQTVAQKPQVEVKPEPPTPEPMPEEIDPAQHIEGFIEPPAEEVPVFDIAALPSELQDLHRRANRVAKVAMQDIKLLRPTDVESGRQHKDICERLRADLDKARKEYDRRFRSISDHPVDYFRHWMLEILAGGDQTVLGKYPYPSSVVRR